MPADISISAIAAFSHDGRVHRAFDHLIAAGVGSLLCVPIAASAGDLRQVVDGCPVPWEEALTVIDTPFAARPLPERPVSVPYLRLEALAGEDWQHDYIRFGEGTHPVLRLGNASGIFYSTLRR